MIEVKLILCQWWNAIHVHKCRAQNYFHLIRMMKLIFEAQVAKQYCCLGKRKSPKYITCWTWTWTIKPHYATWAVDLLKACIIQPSTMIRLFILLWFLFINGTIILTRRQWSTHCGAYKYLHIWRHRHKNRTIFRREPKQSKTLHLIVKYDALKIRTESELKSAIYDLG